MEEGLANLSINLEGGEAPQESIRAALHRYSSPETATPAIFVEHVDVTCDGCEAEPIVGERYQCKACEDRDLCGPCYHALIAARRTMESAASCSLTPQPTVRPKQGPSVSTVKKLKGVPKSRGQALVRVKRTAEQELLEKARRYEELKDIVPCLDPSHTYQLVEGPERQVIGTLPPAPAPPSPPTSPPPPSNPSAAHAPDQTTPLDPSLFVDLPLFLRTFPPSQCATEDLASVCLKRRDHKGSVLAYDPPEASIDRLLAAFEALEKPPPSAPKATSKPSAPTIGPEDVWSLAQRFGVRGGKWMVFVPSASIDAAWGAVVGAYSGGLLGSWVKVTSRSPSSEAQVIMAYVQDSWELPEVDRVGSNLLRCVASAISPAIAAAESLRLTFKPDVYSILGIYHNNAYGIRPNGMHADLAKIITNKVRESL